MNLVMNLVKRTLLFACHIDMEYWLFRTRTRTVVCNSVFYFPHKKEVKSDDAFGNHFGIQTIRIKKG
jgi:hypothetical protein